MNHRAIFGGIARAAAWLVVVAYAAMLLPALLVGFAAYSDYHYRGCPEAMQCSDAGSVATSVFIYVLAAPFVWFGFRALRKAAASRGGEVDA